MFSSLNELLEVGVDGVVIATPGALDVAKTVAALERGVAFYFLRKPLWSVEQDFNLNMAGHTTGCAIKESVFVALRRLRSILDPAEFVCGFLRSDDQRTSATEWNSKEAFPLVTNTLREIRIARHSRSSHHASHCSERCVSTRPCRSGCCRGAEQVFTQLDMALVKAGHESIVVACEGSNTAGILVSVPRPEGVLDKAAREKAWQHYRTVLEQILDRWTVTVVHMHGVDFHEYLPAADVPVLVTLHLPVQWYPPEIFRIGRRRTFLQCVSRSHAPRVRSAIIYCQRLKTAFLKISSPSATLNGVSQLLLDGSAPRKDSTSRSTRRNKRTSQC